MNLSQLLIKISCESEKLYLYYQLYSDLIHVLNAVPTAVKMSSFSGNQKD